MKPKLSVLHLEDNAHDAEFIRVALKQEGIVCDLERVETRNQFLEAVERGGFDLILSDFSLPGFDGLTALSISREKSPAVPFVFVSGTLGEEVAIDSLKCGATDYV